MPDDRTSSGRPHGPHWSLPQKPAREGAAAGDPRLETWRDASARSGPTSAEDDLLPVRMLNEFVYCPRLFHFMHVEGRWADNAYTEQGRHVHRRVDRLDDVLPAPRTAGEQEQDEGAGDEPPAVSRSVTLASDRLGIVAKLDLVSTAGDEAVPVETKRGRVPANAERSWEPERVQLMAQALLLREHGYRCDHAVLYYAGSRTRVDIPLTAELEAGTFRYIEQARLAATSTVLPAPLDDSPKCNGCSLAGICLPDETLALREVGPDPVSAHGGKVRRLYPSRSDAPPLYVQTQGAYVGKRGNVIVVRQKDEELGHVRLIDLDHLVLCGNVGISAQTVHLLCEAGIPIVHVSRGGWFYGITSGLALRNAYDRAAQFHAAGQPDRRLALARAVVTAKGMNQRTMLRRNASPKPEAALARIKRLLRDVATAPSPGTLLGIEGAVAAHYFEHFGRMLKPRDFDADWDFANRNRRPPLDPVNALLSFGYSLLAKECTVAVMAEGLDPWWGLYHQPRHGRPALALDVMEEFRPLIVDSAVISAVNTGMVTKRDFVFGASGCALGDRGRKAFISAYEARLDQLVTHPLFNYRCSWRAMIRVQARLLARWLRGDVPAYTGITTR